MRSTSASVLTLKPPSFHHHPAPRTPPCCRSVAGCLGIRGLRRRRVQVFRKEQERKRRKDWECRYSGSGKTATTECISNFRLNFTIVALNLYPLTNNVLLFNFIPTRLLLPSASYCCLPKNFHCLAICTLFIYKYHQYNY
jgi:hypothetical protein